MDDWGWADVGYHRPGFNETITPNIDALVEAGVNLDQHYAHKLVPNLGHGGANVPVFTSPDPITGTPVYVYDIRIRYPTAVTICRYLSNVFCVHNILSFSSLVLSGTVRRLAVAFSLDDFRFTLMFST